MGKNRRVVVTGMGAITPIGNSVEEFWNGIKEGKTGFGPITYFDTADYRCKLAAEVKDFDPAQYMDKKSARRMEQFCSLCNPSETFFKFINIFIFCNYEKENCRPPTCRNLCLPQAARPEEKGSGRKDRRPV